MEREQKGIIASSIFLWMRCIIIKIVVRFTMGAIETTATFHSNSVSKAFFVPSPTPNTKHKWQIPMRVYRKSIDERVINHSPSPPCFQKV